MAARKTGRYLGDRADVEHTAQGGGNVKIEERRALARVGGLILLGVGVRPFGFDHTGFMLILMAAYMCAWDTLRNPE